MTPEEETRIRMIVLAEYNDALTTEQKQTIMEVKFEKEEDLRAAAKALADKNLLSKDALVSRDANIRRINAALKAGEEYFNLVRKAVEAVNNYRKGDSGNRANLENEITKIFDDALGMEKTAESRIAEAKDLIDKTPLNDEQREDFTARRGVLLEHMPAHSELLKEVMAEFRAMRNKPEK